MVKILDRDSSILRQKAKIVPSKDIKSPRIKKIIRDMKLALDGEDDGVAIAAPQIGAPLRLFVVSPKIFDIVTRKTDKTAIKKPVAKHIICINPVVIKASKEKMVVEEGCLSVRYLYGDVKRAAKIKIRATDEKGKTFEIGGSGLLAQIFQHEIDHLDGILFTDKAANIHDMPPETESGGEKTKSND